ncbi:hypothetical protein CH337_02540 [Rhodoblastus acidophilus]|nr:hypothetical protein CKO16_13250 [Rhodoblastus acidophilus]RAI23953.1 hypothetical protein CH337_02540 [Rhodoblastus acidophilus]
MPATNIDVSAFATSLNDATRALDGGLWSQTASEGNQGAGSLARYQADLATIKTDLANDHSAQATAIQNDIATALNAAPNTIGNGAGVAAAQTAHLDILAQAAMDPLLANAGVTAAPTALNNAAAAPHATFADLGALFNDVVGKSLGGVNAATAPALNAELATIQSGLQTLIQNDAKDFNGLTAVHAQTIANQLGLEQNYNSQAGSSSIARADRTTICSSSSTSCRATTLCCRWPTKSGRSRPKRPRRRRLIRTTPLRPISGRASSPRPTRWASRRRRSSAREMRRPSPS